MVHLQADANSTTSYFPLTYISQYYNRIVRPMMTILVRNSKSRALLCWGRIICSKISSTDIFEHINAPFLDLSWNTEKCRSEEIRGGTFSIYIYYIILLWERSTSHLPPQTKTSDTESMCKMFLTEVL